MDQTTQQVTSSVRAELARKGLSGRDLAAAMDWSTSATHRRLNGRTRFTVEELTAVAAYLRVPLTVLIPLSQSNVA